MQTEFDIKYDLTFREYIFITLIEMKKMKIIKRLLGYFVLVVALFIVTTFLSDEAKTIWFMLPIVVLMPFLLIFTITMIISIVVYILKPTLFKNISYKVTHWGVIKQEKILI